MQFLAEYGMFLAKSITLVAAALIVAAALVSLSQRQRKTDEQRLEVTCLNKQYEQMEKTLSAALLSPQQLKQKQKAEKKANKDKAKADKRAAAGKAKGNGNGNGNSDGDGGEKPARRIYVVDFNGDIRASAVASLRREISAILTLAGGGDEVVVRLESGGGVVHGYGLAASQLRRIRDRQIPLTIAVDKIAASGGYMMACVADKIIAAPFAFIGSIGVLLQIPNLHRLLKKHDVEFEQVYSGEYKRTLTMFGENTPKGRKKLQRQMEETHDLFKQHVKTQRPGLDIEAVSTGEYWLGSRALELGLVDALQTSDDYLMAAREDAQLLLVKYAEKKKMVDRFASLMHGLVRNDPADGLDRPLLM